MLFSPLYQEVGLTILFGVLVIFALVVIVIGFAINKIMKARAKENEGCLSTLTFIVGAGILAVGFLSGNSMNKLSVTNWLTIILGAIVMFGPLLFFYFQKPDDE